MRVENHDSIQLMFNCDTEIGQSGDAEKYTVTGNAETLLLCLLRGFALSMICVMFEMSGA